MACGQTFTSGIGKGCNDAQGGLKKIWIAQTENVLTILPAVSTETTGIITSFTMATASKFYEFAPTKFTAKWVDNAKQNGNHGGFSYEPTVTIPFSKNEASKRNAIKLLGKSDVTIITLDQNNKYWLHGETNGMTLITAAYDSGAALTDPNLWTLTFTGYEPNPSREVDATWISGTGSSFFVAS